MPSPNRPRAALAGATLAACALLAVPTVATEPAPWRHHGPEGGWLTTLHRDHEGLWAGSYGGGLFRSTDDGLSWEDLTAQTPGTVLWDIERGSDAGNSIYLGTADATILRTDDGQSVFTAVRTGVIGFPEVRGVDVSTLDPFEISIATTDGIYTSRNRGNLWPDSLHALPGFTTWDVQRHPATPDSIWGLGDFDLFYTRDEGRSITFVNDGLPRKNMRQLLLWPGSPDTMFVVSLDEGVHRRSSAAGFFPVTPPRPAGIPWLYRVRPTQGQGLVLAGGAGLWRSEDLGASWVPDDGGLGLAEPSVWDVLVEDAASGELSLASFRRGFLHAPAGGGPWEPRNFGLVASWVQGLGEVAGVPGAVLAADAHGRLHRSDDGGRSWSDITGPLDLLQLRDAVELADGSLLVAANSALARSTDGGQSWTTQAGGALDLPGFRFAAAPWLGPSVAFLASDGGVLRTTDGGASWEPAPGFPPGERCRTLVAAAADSLVLAAVDGQGLHLWRGSGPAQPLDLPVRVASNYFAAALGPGAAEIFVAAGGELLRLVRSGDGSYSVQDGGPGLPGWPGGVLVEGLVLDPDDGTLYAGLQYDGVWRSRDGGASWEDFSDGLLVGRTVELALSASTPRILHAATLAKGVAWRPVEAGVGLVASPLVARRAGPGRVELELEAARPLQLRLTRRSLPDGAPLELHRGPAAGRFRWTDGSAPAGELAYAVELRERVGGPVLARSEQRVDATQPPVLATRLRPNAPNPFNPTTVLHFELARAGRVRLDVHDARGRRVATVADRPFAAGAHALRYTATDARGFPLPSGVYHVLLQAEGRRDSRAITLVR